MRKSLLAFALGAGMLSMSAVNAQGQGYIGAGAGWGNIGVDCSGIDNCDKSNTGGKIYGGFRFANTWALEAMYIDWGKATGQATDTLLAATRAEAPQATGTVTVDGKLRATGFGIAAAYFMPFSSNWNGVARLGVMRNEGKLSGTGTSGGVSLFQDSSKKAAFAYVGLGVGYNLTPNLALTGEADFSRVKYGIEGEYEKDSVRLISVGLRYAF